MSSFTLDQESKMAIKRSLDTMNTSFGGSQKDARLEYYTKELFNSRFNRDQILKGLLEAPKRFKYFPSLSELLETIPLYSDRVKDKEKEMLAMEENSRLARAEREKESRLREKYNALYGEDAMNKFYQLYYKNVFGDNLSDGAAKYGLELRSFQRCALFDLESGEGNSTRAIEIGREQ